MKRIALTLLAVAAVAVAVESTASASDRSHRRSDAVRHAIGDLIFGGHQSYGRDRGHSSYRAPSYYGSSSYGHSSYSQRSYSQPGYSYSPSFSRRSYARPSYGYSNRGYGSSRGFGYSSRRCD